MEMKNEYKRKDKDTIFVSINKQTDCPYFQFIKRGVGLVVGDNDLETSEYYCGLLRETWKNTESGSLVTRHLPWPVCGQVWEDLNYKINGLIRDNDYGFPLVPKDALKVYAIDRSDLSFEEQDKLTLGIPRRAYYGQQGLFTRWTKAYLSHIPEIDDPIKKDLEDLTFEDIISFVERYVKKLETVTGSNYRKGDEFSVEHCDLAPQYRDTFPKKESL